jgi:hypothetical protein
MDDEPTSAWPQPLTFGGVAAFAHASFGRLWTIQAIVAVLAALVVTLFFELNWVPPIVHTIQALPASGVVENARLSWPQNSTPVHTAESSFLWISVDPTSSLETMEGADLHVTFGGTGIRFGSIFGYVSCPYVDGYTIAANRSELEPWWGAWHPAITIGLGVLAVLGLFLVWTVLAWAYAWPARLIAFYADRRLSWAGAWRLSSAALLPGALFLTVAIVAYGLRHLNLVQLLAAGVLHVMIGWVYLLFSPFCLPREPSPGSRSAPRNPFSGMTTKGSKNPFAGPANQG